MDFGEIEVIAESVGSIIDASHNSEELIANLPRAVSGHHGVYYLVMDNNEGVLYQSHGIKFSPQIQSLPKRDKTSIYDLQEWQDNGQHYIGTKIKHYSKLTGQEYAIAVVISTDSHAQFLHSLDKKSWWMVMLAITVAATMTILVVRFGHRPLYRIARTLRDISTNNLDRRLALKDAPQELLPVINEINDMLQRLESSYERLSHYSADIAHELKTPVNNLMTQMQVILSRDRSIDNYKETLYSALEECEHMAQMINDLLFLAKADDLTHSLDLKPVPIKTEIENMIDYYAPLAEERHINFKIEGQDIEVIAEPVLLRRALSNLYANAINYSPPNTVVNTRIYAENQNKKLKETLFVEIENTVTPVLVNPNRTHFLASFHS